MPTEEPSVEQELEAKFGHILIESFSAKDERVPTVIEKLNAILKEKGEEQIALVWGEGDLEAEPEESEPIRKEGKAKENYYHSRRLTVIESDISLSMLVRRIAVIADLRLTIEKERIWLADRYCLIGSALKLFTCRVLPRYAWVFEKPREFFELRGIFFGSDLTGTPERVAFDKESRTLIFSVLATGDTHKVNRMLKLIEPLRDHSLNESREQGNSGKPD